MSNTNEFFSSRKTHSEIKLKILKEYLFEAICKMAFSKFNTKKMVRIFDGFAGVGKYEDGEEGSPAIITEEMLKMPKCGNNVQIKIHFCEKNIKNFEKLENFFKERMKEERKCEKFFIYKNDKKNLKVFGYNLEFEKCINNIIKRREKDVPLFAFIDPFGYKNITMDLIKKIMESGKTEIMLNFMYEEINRFITSNDESLSNTYLNLFGCTKEELEILKENLRNETSQNRKDILTKFYKKQIRMNNYYIAHFDIYKNNKMKMIIFFITKNKIGFNLFKKQKIKILEEKDQEEKKGRIFYESNEEKVILEIEKYILNKYSGKELRYEELLEDIYDHDEYIEKYLKKAIKKLEKKESVIRIKNGKLSKIFKGTVIKFKEVKI